MIKSYSTWLLLAAFTIITACAETSPQPAHPTRAKLAESSLPPIKQFRAQTVTRPSRSNADIARDFLDLSFSLESGRALPAFTRFEGPITVKLVGRTPSTLRSDLSVLINRLRTEAGIDIREVRDERANVIIQAVGKSEIKRALPHAACFVVPNVSDLNEYRRARGRARTDWVGLQSRQQLAIFLPYDTSPQDMRDCLHEELAQAIGPLNDLYRLDDSVFNDDNVHATLTGFDMLILRAYYDPALHNGMTQRQVAERLPGIFNRINPRGNHSRFAPRNTTPRAWINAIQEALGPTGTSGRRVSAAQAALDIATSQGWGDHRRAFSHFAYARVLQFRNPHQANRHYQLADQFYQASVPEGPHRASVAAPRAAYALASGDPQTALRIIDRHLPDAQRFQNAVHLSSLLMIKAEAHNALGQTSAAQSAHLDSLGWARYGFGPEWIVRAKLREVALLNPDPKS
ncbi:DUF2927 domain-containing protein [Cognatishimia sp.]|uniref:DUF2927 domain-containing protein n=1 Tax=Cognatishimia sp. TaxID=2211648 RepID=UPI003BAB98F5